MIRAKALSRLLALCLLVQWVGAFGHCLRASAAGLDLVICSYSSARTPAGEDGGAQKPEDHKARPVCCACTALPGVEVPPAPLVSSPVSWPVVIAWAPEPLGASHPPARAPPPPARGPPRPA